MHKFTMTSNTVDGITIRMMTEGDFKNVKIFLGEDFLKSEPLCQASGEDVQRQNEKEFDEYNLSMIAQDTCLVALDENDGGRIVGCVLAGAQLAEDADKRRIEADALGQHTLGHTNRMISKLEREANLLERFGVSKVLCSDTTSVGASVRGKGLGSRLASTLMEVGRSKGFPAMVAYCTSFYSARQKEALGMQCIYSLTYADYKDVEGRPIFTPATPHTMARVMFIQL